MVLHLSTEITFLPGVGPKRAELLNKELNIFTLNDLLYTFPYKYIDRTRFYKISEITEDLPYIQIIGQIVRFNEVGGPRAKRLSAVFTDGTGTIDLVWFKGLKWILKGLKPGVNYLLFGKPTLFNGKWNIVHPELEEITQQKFQKGVAALQPAYSTTERLKNSFITSKVILKWQLFLADVAKDQIEETLPSYLLDRLKMMTLPEAMKQIHFPESAALLKKAQLRLKFEELLYVQLSLLRLRTSRQMQVNGHNFKLVGENFNRFYSENLPFELTEAQKRVMREIRKDLGSGKQMNRLLQGDVGSGKTLVALMCMLLAMDNGFQSAIMAPTEILATQHYNTITEFLKGLPVEVALLTGSTKKKERTRMFEMLSNGSLGIIIGTHALIEDPVQFKNLGLVVVDEQQRFGVAQRAKLWAKNIDPPHILVMTATPIPRTLAMTVYGDLDVSVIDELPPGRKVIKTLHYTDVKRNVVFGMMREQIRQGRQIYVVYPLIQESEKMDYKDLMDGYDSISRAFPPPEYATVVVHGKMKADEKEASMQLFVQGKAHIMVATTVIEVGVNVPNATVMVIESAERFGLSQLHQLRGRVGRGANESYCILMSGVKLSNESRKRMETMVSTNDGFVIAEVDLELRGPGDLEGTQQSGLPFDFKIANIGQDGQILQLARNIANEILEEDKLLNYPKNSVLKFQLDKMQRKKLDFSQIS